jgi:DNA repair photolyase
MLQGALFQECQVVSQSYKGNVIYETSGRAREYRELACNLYTGCGHQCVYCYAPNVTRCNRERFYENVTPRADILRKLERDAIGYSQAGEKRQILFCFTSDPYQPMDERYQLTRRAIEICHRHGLDVCTLTKGGKRALRDLDLFTPRDAFATTLTLLDANESAKWEPGAASPEDRLATLEAFHRAGIPTWVSLEPVIDPATTLEIIRQAHGFVDEFKVGKLNYHPQARRVNWRKFALDARELLEGYGCRYYLKQDLRALLG